MAVVERKVVVSGETKYVELNAAEQGAYLLRFYFTDLTTQEHPYINFEWNPDRKFFGRFAFAQGVYIYQEKLVHFNQELMAEFRADALVLNHHAQCAYVDVQSVGLDSIASQAVSALTGFLFSAVPVFGAVPIAVTALSNYFLSAVSEAFTKRGSMIGMLAGEAGNPPTSLQAAPYKAIKPRVAPGHPVTGFYYSMSDGASGEVTIRAHYFDDQCTLPGTSTPASGNENPPPPASSGGPDVPGGGGRTPPSSGDSAPPTPGLPAAPSQEIPTPGLPPSKPGQSPDQTEEGVNYLVKFGFTLDGIVESQQGVYRGKISGYQTVTVGGVGGKTAFWTSSNPSGGPPLKHGEVSWNVNGFPNQIPSGFFVQVIRRV